MCMNHDVFVVDDTATMDHDMAVYMNDIMCGQNTGR